MRRRRRLNYPSPITKVFLYDKKGNIVMARIPRFARKPLIRLADILNKLDIGVLIPTLQDSVTWRQLPENRRKRGRTLKWAFAKKTNA